MLFAQAGPSGRLACVRQGSAGLIALILNKPVLGLPPVPHSSKQTQCLRQQQVGAATLLLAIRYRCLRYLSTFDMASHSLAGTDEAEENEVWQRAGSDGDSSFEEDLLTVTAGIPSSVNVGGADWYVAQGL